MDMIFLSVTVVSLIVALVMSVTAWRMARDEKQRSAARVAALSLAADTGIEAPASIPVAARSERPIIKAPWSPPMSTARPSPAVTTSPLGDVELPLNSTRGLDAPRNSEPVVAHATGFLGASATGQESGGHQKSLAFAAIALFVLLSGGLFVVMSDRGAASAAATSPGAPLELVSLTHDRQDRKLSISGLVRNPASGTAVEKLSAVVFLFDPQGTFVTSARANVDFLKLGAGDESPFVVSIDAPPTVSRYRVSFRTDDGIVPHVDRRSAHPAAAAADQQVNVTLK